MLNYAYNDLDFFQNKKIVDNNMPLPIMLKYDVNNKAPSNIFRTMGVDFDKYQASSSLLILDFDAQLNKFKVFKRIELPRAEYSYDTAYRYIIEANEIYNPSFIYCDRGSGEYIIERLHIYGDQHPETNLKNKVKGWSFANKLDVMDPITKTIDKKPLKQFMVNQMQLVFERNRMILSPYDDIIYKQLVDYEVEKITEAGIAKFTSKDEHFVDALGLAYLAMVLEFKQLTGTIESVKNATKISSSKKSIGVDKAPLHALNSKRSIGVSSDKIDDDHPYDKQRWIKGRGSEISGNRFMGSSRSSNWGSRFQSGGRGGFSR